jgi:DNA-binding cell septation regulator SpoVG
MPSSTISPRVVGIKPTNGKGNLKAFASVKLSDDITIHEWRVIQQPGQRAWVSSPQREWTDAAGKRRFAPVCEPSKDLAEEITRLVLEAWLSLDDSEVTNA